MLFRLLLLSMFLLSPILASSAPLCDKRVFAAEGASSGHYELQKRDEAAAAWYRHEMDYVAPQKLGLATFLLPNEGLVADMGSGSGYTTFVLSQNYPDVRFVGVDINPEMVLAAQKAHSSENLFFQIGDIAKPIFPARSLKGIINSSSLHHVNSFAGDGYSIHEVIAAIGQQVEQLSIGGVLVIRDFVIPKGPAQVILEVSNTNGVNDPLQNVTTLSTSALFRRFAQDFRSSVHREEPVRFTWLPSVRPDVDRYQVDLRTQAEFVHHKDYRNSWASELLEEYTYMGQNQLEHLLRLHNLRILVSRPIFNPWILKNRFEGQFRVTDLQGKELPFPPTNLMIAGERVGPDQGVMLEESHHETVHESSFLRMAHMRHHQTNEIYDVVQRPGQAVDVLPYFKKGDKIYVVSRRSYPRPILNAKSRVTHLGDVTTSGYIAEPISFLIPEGESVVNAAVQGLTRRTNLLKNDPSSVMAMAGSSYFPSPGGIAERVVPVTVELPSDHPDLMSHPIGPFSTSGELRMTEAVQALQAYQVGGGFDARLELGVYRLLKQLKKPFGAWIGAEVKPQEQDIAAPKAFSWRQLKRPSYSWEQTDTSAHFLEIRRGHFVEKNGSEHELASQDLEYVVPSRLSHHTVNVLPMALIKGELWVGVEKRDLPVPQILGSSSTLLTVPAFRVPLSEDDRWKAQRFAFDHLQKVFQAKTKGELIALGAEYRVSPGITPEIVYPFVVEVEPSSSDHLHWMRLKQLLAKETELEDAQLLTSLFRLSHAVQGK